LFSAISSGDAKPIIDAFAERHEHIFIGQHALGGRRTRLQRTREWYERLLRLLPDISFQVTSLEVRGAPWDTIVLVEWTETNSGTDGVRTSNTGVHIVHLSWGRMTRLYILTDTLVLQKTLDRLASAGVSEATAPPIED
jgi:ketosteroid isomerase-like protein